MLLDDLPDRQQVADYGLAVSDQLSCPFILPHVGGKEFQCVGDFSAGNDLVFEAFELTRFQLIAGGSNLIFKIAKYAVIDGVDRHGALPEKSVCLCRDEIIICQLDNSSADHHFSLGLKLLIILTLRHFPEFT